MHSFSLVVGPPEPLPDKDRTEPLPNQASLCSVARSLFLADDERWTPQEDEDVNDSAPAAADELWQQDGEGLEEGDWLRREDSPSEASLEHAANDSSGHHDDGDT